MSWNITFIPLPDEEVKNIRELIDDAHLDNSGGYPKNLYLSFDSLPHELREKE
jgi:hypothetical protein